MVCDGCGRTGRFAKAGESGSYFEDKGVPRARDLRQMSNYFDISQLEANKQPQYAVSCDEILLCLLSIICLLDSYIIAWWLSLVALPPSLPLTQSHQLSFVLLSVS